VEEATAKAAVLPRALALPLVLWPVAARRVLLSRRIARLVAAAVAEAEAAEAAADAEAEAPSAPAELGPWLRAFRDPGASGVSVSAGQGAELVIGLLFAAHKARLLAPGSSRGRLSGTTAHGSCSAGQPLLLLALATDYARRPV
jgi:hypothetical protein